MNIHWIYKENQYYRCRFSLNKEIIRGKKDRYEGRYVQTRYVIKAIHNWIAYCWSFSSASTIAAYLSNSFYI